MPIPISSDSPRRRFALLVATLGVCLAFAAGAEAQDKNAKQGKILADSKFRPNPNGFSFENWGGDDYPYSDLTGNEAAALFGDRVCARWEKNTCVPTPAAKLWISTINQSMKGGHCEGLAAMSAAFHVKAEKLNTYEGGAQQTYALNPRDEALLGTISTYFSTQFIEPVSTVTADTRNWSLQKKVDYMVKLLNSGKDYVTLGIYGADGGHAITPYMVEEQAPGRYRIYVYDNNYPGSEKYVDIDVKKNEWTYAAAALNPKEDASPWMGDAAAMDLTALSLRYEPLKCPFCGAHEPPKAPRPAAAPKSPRGPSIGTEDISIVTPNRCSQVRATDKKTKKQLTGGKNGKSEIPGATMVSLRGARGCSIRLPGTSEYDLSLVDDGRPSYQPLTDLAVFALGTVYSISDILLSAGTSQNFGLKPDSFTYQAGGSQKPTLRVAGDRAGSNGYYVVTGFTLGDGYEFGAKSDDSGKIVFSDNDPALLTYDIEVEEVSETGSESYEFLDVETGDDGEAVLDLDSEDMLADEADDEADEADDEADEADDEADEADDEADEADDEAEEADDEADEADDEADEADDEADEADDEADEADDEAEEADDEADEADEEAEEADEEADEADDEAEEADEEAYEADEEADEADDEADEADEEAYEADEEAEEADDEAYEADEEAEEADDEGEDYGS